MSDKRSGSGRWDHLLREIPSQHTAKAPSPKPLKNHAPTKISRTPKPTRPPMPQVEEVVEHEAEILSVSDINKAIKKKLEGGFAEIWVQGEISNFKHHSSGHFYFSLKDEKAQVNAVMFRGFNSRLKFTPESGMEVVVRGRITVYEPRGNYQVFCEHMEPVGAGALQKAFEQLKAKLQKEGLFAEKLKKPIPELPKRVGVVTSPTGAAIQDILNVLRRRSQRVEVVVIPARVQGDVAAKEVVQGIELANQVGGFDVLIVGRGGGSIEDLWCFNEEIVARAIHASEIPIISSVGHEIDFTISDFVADLRAPTPSAAAELVTQSEEELKEKLKFYSKSLRLTIFQQIKDLQQRIEHSRNRLIDPRRYLQDCMMRLDDWGQRLHRAQLRHIERLGMRVKVLRQSLASPTDKLQKAKQQQKSLLKLLMIAMQKAVEKNRNQIEKSMSLLDSLSPLKVVDRGYGIIRQNKKVMADASGVNQGPIEIELRDGLIEAQVQKVRKKEKSHEL